MSTSHENGQICISDEAISIERASVLHSLVAVMQGIKEPRLSPEFVEDGAGKETAAAYQTGRRSSCLGSLVLKLTCP